MLERTQRTRIEDLAAVGEELAEEHLRLVSGARRRRLNGTSTAIATYVVDIECKWDADED